LNMRRTVAFTLIALALSAGALAAGLPALAGVAVTGAASTRLVARSRTSSATRTRTSATMRTWSLSLKPAPDDLALAEIRFPRAARRAITRRLLHVSMEAPFGSDYLAVAIPRSGVSLEGMQAFVLLVNRPSALEDPARVRLLLSAQRQLGEHELWRVENPFAGTSSSAALELCDLATHGPTLQAVELAPLRSTGAALGGFDVAAAVAQAYDVACGLPYESVFKQLVTGSSTQPQPAPSQPEPAPTPPTPPVGRLPGEGCTPAPGYACPAVLKSSFSAAVRDGERQAAAGAH
jgi:hypothetical protein